MAHIVDINTVSIREGTWISSSTRTLKQFEAILTKQGLIEPLLCYRGTLEVGRQVWDAERLTAARNLGWKTVIVTDGTY